jgi:prevent-host-death family protein
MQWKLADAKNRFSELVNKALLEGPQWVSRRNDQIVVLSKQRYDELVGQQEDFKSFLLSTSSPSLDDLDIKRDKSSMRDVEL